MIELERTPDGRINNCALANFDEESNCQVCHGTCPDRERLAVEGFAVTDHSKTKIGKWLEKARAADLDQYVRPEIQALAKRGNVTPAEVAELRINSWEWEHLTPAMNDEAFVARVEHALKNCSPRGYPSRSYDDAVYGLYAPELLKRFKLQSLAARDYGGTLEGIREALGQKNTHYLVMADDVAIVVKALEWYASKMSEKVDGTRAKVALAALRDQAEFLTCESCDKKIVVLASESDAVPATFCEACGGGRASVLFEELMP